MFSSYLMKRSMSLLLVGTMLFCTKLTFAVEQQPVNEQAVEQQNFSEVKSEAKDFIQVLREYEANQREDALKYIRQFMAKVDVKLDALEEKIDNRWEEMDQASQQELQSSVEQLKSQRVAMTQWLDDLKEGGVNTWDNIKTGLSSAYLDLQDTWQEIETDLKNKAKVEDETHAEDEKM